MEKLLYILIGSGVTLLVLVMSSALISRVFVARSKRRLIRTISKEKLPAFRADQTVGLPAPVQRYLQTVLKDGQPILRYAVLQQKATFRHRQESPWFRVKATEVISGMEPGWVWDAVLTHNAAWWRTAKLSYVQGAAHGHIKLYGAFTLQEFEGPETDTSMLFRLLSELVWIPTALLPTKTLRWEQVNDSTARAVISDGQTRVSALFHFNDNNEIDRIVTSDKYRDHKSGFEQAQFTMLCSNYQTFEGVRIPTQVDFIWNLASGDFDYGHFTLTSAAYYYS
jgi:hypothetical protein